MKAISKTVYPPGYKRPECVKEQTKEFNKWISHIHKQPKKLKLAS